MGQLRVHPPSGWRVFLVPRLLPAYILAWACAGVHAAEPDPASLSLLKSLSVDELLNIRVTTVSRRTELLAETASGVQVITQEDIRRSGAATLPQVLRLAPNLQVARLGAGAWAITARGFNEASANAATSNKLLVMIDGRSVYSPLFSGTFWDTQDVFLADVDRIEVVSGPGGSTWGANAVNGVVNILSKPAQATQGTLVYGGGGGEERALGGVRYGGRVGERTFYRVYAKHLDIDSTVLGDGSDARDRQVLTQGGFRMDHATPSSLLTVQGDVYRGWNEERAAPRSRVEGGNVATRLSHTLADGSRVQVQAYFDRAERRAVGTFSDVLDTYDLDAQHHFRLGERHDVVWGGGFRAWHDRIENPPEAALLPADSTEYLKNVFIQDEVELVPDRWRLTLGAKFEDNTYSGSELQPSVRLAWLVHPDHMLWGAVSRAVRTPSRIDRDLHAPAVPPHTIIAGGPDFEAEELVAYELGWRGAGWGRTSWSVTAFVHVYDNLRSIEPPFPLRIANGVEGETHGVELTFTHELTDWWRWSAGYTYLGDDIGPESGSQDINRGQAESADPQHQALVQSSLDLPAGIELDLNLRHAGELEHISDGTPSRVPAYTELSVRLGWIARENLEFSLVGRNLLHDHHAEFGSPENRREIERSVYAQAVWTY